MFTFWNVGPQSVRLGTDGFVTVFAIMRHHVVSIRRLNDDLHEMFPDSIFRLSFPSIVTKWDFTGTTANWNQVCLFKTEKNLFSAYSETGINCFHSLNDHEYLLGTNDSKCMNYLGITHQGTNEIIKLIPRWNNPVSRALFVAIIPYYWSSAISFVRRWWSLLVLKKICTVSWKFILCHGIIFEWILN